MTAATELADSVDEGPTGAACGDVLQHRLLPRGQQIHFGWCVDHILDIFSKKRYFIKRAPCHIGFGGFLLGFIDNILHNLVGGEALIPIHHTCHNLTIGGGVFRKNHIGGVVNNFIQALLGYFGNLLGFGIAVFHRIPKALGEIIHVG